MLDGSRAEGGLRFILERAHEIAYIDAERPTTSSALTLLASAIVASALDDDINGRLEALRAGLMPQRVLEYLDKYEDRFWLVHPKYPFYQCDPALPTPDLKHKPASVVLFIDVPPDQKGRKLYQGPLRHRIPWQDAARCLVEIQMFDLGGPTFTHFPDKQTSKGVATHADAAIAGGGCIMTAVGQNLFNTLLINAPIRQGRDAPTWERKPGYGPRLIHDAGPIAFITANPRTVLFDYTNGEIGETLFGAGENLNSREVHYLAGFVVSFEEKKNSGMRYDKARLGSERSSWRWSFGVLAARSNRLASTALDNLRYFARNDHVWESAAVVMSFAGYSSKQKNVKSVDKATLVIPASFLVGSESDISNRTTAMHEMSKHGVAWSNKAVMAERVYRKNAEHTAIDQVKDSTDLRARVIALVGEVFEETLPDLQDIGNIAKNVELFSVNVKSRVRIILERHLESGDDLRSYAIAMNYYLRESTPKSKARTPKKGSPA